MCSDVLKRSVRAVLDHTAGVGPSSVGAVAVDGIPPVVGLLLCEMTAEGEALLGVDDCEHG